MHRIFTLAGNIAIKKRKNAFSRLEYVYVTTALNNDYFIDYYYQYSGVVRLQSRQTCYGFS